MSQQMPEQAGGEAGTPDAVVISDGVAEAAAPSSPGIEARLIASDHEAPHAEALEPEALKAEEPKIEEPKVEAARAEPPKAEPRAPGRILVMSPGDRSGPRPEAEAAPVKRRIAAMAAVVALAAIAGALSGALATAGMMHFAARDGAGSEQAQTQAQSHAQELQTSVARIDADVLALKASVEHTSKVATGQFNKASDRLDKLEKAQAEPAAKIAKLSDTVDKLRAAQAAAPAAASPKEAAKDASKETTGSIAVAAATPMPVPAPPRTEVGRLPTVEGWVLRDVSRGGALIEGRQGLYEVYAGDPVPGLGRVDAIRRQDGRWVVVTTKGLIVAR